MLHLRLLGHPSLTDHSGRAVSLWRPELALLALVGSSPEGIRREAASALLWPESPEARARGALRQSLFRLRRRAGDAVRTEDGLLALDPDRVTVDVLELDRRLGDSDPEGAVERYAGPFLDGFSLSGSAAFDRWADARRAELERRIVKRLQALLRDADGRGEWPKAVEWAERLVALSPLSGEAARGLVRALALAGDRDRALGAYRDFRDRLREEPDLEPPGELEALAERIRAGEEPSAVRTSAPADPAPRAPKEAPSGPGTWPMLGRGSEFRRLRARWEEARGGRHRLVLLGGEPGIGKTRLGRELAEHVRLEGATVLQGRAYEVERGVPYASLAGILRTALAAPGLAGMDAAALGELSRIVPSFARRFPAGVERPAPDLAGGRFRLMHAFHSLLENLAYEAPLLVFLDDLPWADEATVAVLHYAWRNLPDRPVLLLLAARSGDLTPDEPAHRFWTSAIRTASEAVDEIVLGPLPSDAVARLAGPDRDAPTLHRRTGGNPLFLLELLRASAEGAGGRGGGRPREPDSLGVVVGDRVRRLSDEERRLLGAAAVLGRRFPLPTAAAMAELEPRAAARAAGRLEERGLVRQAGVGYDFVHDVVRETVWESLPPEERRLLHRAAFHRLAPEVPAVEESGPETAPGRERAGALARHAAEGGLAVEAFRWSLEAARQAEEIYADAEAAAYLTRARAAASTPEELRKAWARTGHLEWRRTRFAEAALAFLQAVWRADPRTPERLRLRLRLLEASLRGGLVDAPELLDELAPLLEEARVTGVPALPREARSVAAVVRDRANDRAGALHEARAATAAAEEAGEPAPRVRALLLQARMALRAGAADEILPTLDRAVAAGRADGLVRELCDALADRGTELARLGCWDEALETWHEGLDLARGADDFGAEAILRLNLSDLLARRGDRNEALLHLERAEALCRRFRFPHVQAAIPVNRGLAAWFSGDPVAAADQVAPALEDAEAGRASGPDELPAHARAARSLALLGLLESEAGKGAVRETLAALEESGEGDHATWSDDREIVAVARARAREALGDRPGALEVLEGAGDRVDDPFGRGLLLLEEARLRAPGDRPRAEALAAEARKLLEPLGLRTPGGLPFCSP